MIEPAVNSVRMSVKVRRPGQEATPHPPATRSAPAWRLSDSPSPMGWSLRPPPRPRPRPAPGETARRDGRDLGAEVCALPDAARG
eukprot:scaffold30051_cov111-Isochrysis_galbana.AAC.4